MARKSWAADPGSCLDWSEGKIHGPILAPFRKAKFQDDEVMLELPLAAGACSLVGLARLRGYLGDIINAIRPKRGLVTSGNDFFCVFVCLGFGAIRRPTCDLFGARCEGHLCHRNFPATVHVMRTLQV